MENTKYEHVFVLTETNTAKQTSNRSVLFVNLCTRYGLELSSFLY